MLNIKILPVYFTCVYAFTFHNALVAAFYDRKNKFILIHVDITLKHRNKSKAGKLIFIFIITNTKKQHLRSGLGTHSRRGYRGLTFVKGGERGVRFDHCTQLYKNEIIWTQTGVRAPQSPILDPPLHSVMTSLNSV